MTASGWAVKDAKGIRVQTVAETQRGAIVNWLVLYARTRVLDSHSNTEINNMWRRLCGDAKTIRVLIEENA